MRIGFVGLGLMGMPMARHLVGAGHQLFIASSSKPQLAELAAQGATICATPRDIASQVDIFFSCRVTPQHSMDTFLGDDGVIQAVSNKLLCIDLATIDPETTCRIGRALAGKGIAFLDAPISGGPNGAAAKTLSIIVGGEIADVERAQPLFNLLGKKVFHMGPVGTGVMAKLCNNMITITTHALLAEAMVMGVKAGIDGQRLYDVLSASSAYSRSLERVVPHHFLNRNFVAASNVTSVMKDLQCAIDTGTRLGLPLRLPNVAMSCYVDALDSGYAESDIAAVILPMEELAGVKVGSAPTGASSPVT
jgi:3-hydroxyisobutyrate dehydrogenase-like beta-hydroxyacid dehydrogenase